MAAYVPRLVDSLLEEYLAEQDLMVVDHRGGITVTSENSSEAFLGRIPASQGHH